MDILDEMEAALRFYANRENVTYYHPYGEGDTIVGPASKALREYESLKGQIAVVPVQTSEARQAALDDFWHITDTGTMEHFVHTHALTIEAALRQPDTSEAVRILVDGLAEIREIWAGQEGGKAETAYEGFLLQEQERMYRVAADAINHPAVIAAMKGVDHEKVI